MEKKSHIQFKIKSCVSVNTHYLPPSEILLVHTFDAPSFPLSANVITGIHNNEVVEL